MEEINNLLDEEIKAEIEALSSMSFGSKEHLTATENLAALYKLRIDETKTMLDFKEKTENRKHDDEFEKEQLAEQVKDRYFRLGIATAELVLPLMFYAVWMHRGFKFEEDGTYTSSTFRGLFNRFRPTKK